MNTPRERAVSALSLSLIPLPHGPAFPSVSLRPEYVRAGVNVTYKPTYFQPPPKLRSQRCARAWRTAPTWQPSFSVVTAFKSPACIANINAAARFLSGCCCHGDRGAVWDLKATWSKRPLCYYWACVCVCVAACCSVYCHVQH